MGEIERTKYLVKMPGQCTRGALDVQAKAGVAHQVGNGKRRLIVTG